MWTTTSKKEYYELLITDELVPYVSPEDKMLEFMGFESKRQAEIREMLSKALSQRVLEPTY